MQRDPYNPPKPDTSVNEVILCGYCKYRCCTGKRTVHTTPIEVIQLGLPSEMKTKGGCQCLGGFGCVLKEDKPVECKVFPLTVRKGNILTLTWFSRIHCPRSRHYEFTHQDNEGFHYRRTTKFCPSHANSYAEITLPKPIEEMPTAFQIAQQGLQKIYGKGGLGAIARLAASLLHANTIPDTTGNGGEMGESP